MPMPEPSLPMQKPAGGLPSPMAQASPNGGPVSAPQGNHGNMQAAMTKVSSGLKMLQEALPLIPRGNELHTKLLSAVKTIAEVMSKEGESPSNPKLDMSAIVQMLRQHAQNAPQNAMARMMPASGPTQSPAMGAASTPPAGA